MRGKLGRTETNVFLSCHMNDRNVWGEKKTERQRREETRKIPRESVRKTDRLLVSHPVFILWRNHTHTHRLGESSVVLVINTHIY